MRRRIDKGVRDEVMRLGFMSTATAMLLLVVLASSTLAQTKWPDKIWWCARCGNRQMVEGECSVCSSDETKKREGWITTEWHQDSPFNHRCPNNLITAEKCVVGCVATALTQILNYWQYPTGMSFDDRWLVGDDYVSKGDLNGDNKTEEWEKINIDHDSLPLDFPSFQELNDRLSRIDYANPEVLEYLCFGAGVKLKTDYGATSGASTRMAGGVFREHAFYGSASVKREWDDAVKRKVIQNIKEGYPVQIAASGKYPSHSMIIDGYDSETDCFHINMGQASNLNTWYHLPDFSPGNYWDTIHTAVLDILPFFGWHQYGGNQENTFRTIYAAPSESPIREKWRGTVRPNCRGMIVGSGNNIYITKNPLIVNDPSYHPTVVIVNQYGEKLDEIEITQTSSAISHPVQSQNGDIYFGAGDSVYRLRPSDKTCVRVFSDAGNDFYGDRTPRLDEDGRMYFGSDTTLVCLSPTGVKLWPSMWTCPSGAVMYTGIPSIDKNRNNVYISYWRSSAQAAHLVCIDRMTGKTKYETSFPGISTADRGIHTPAIGSDGTVYVSVRTKLGALVPGQNSFTEKWPARDFLYARHQPIALGKDDTIYTEYWTLRSGSYYVTFAALDPSDGHVKWDVQKADQGSYTNFGQPYCAGNGVVVFPVKWDTSPQRFELFAYRDEGNSGQELWNYSTGLDENAKVAMGPGATIYLYQNDLITALSNGSVGDPDGGGMCYLDNVRPYLPGDPSPADGSTGADAAVTLSWSCSDPEGHSMTYSVFVGEAGYDMVPAATGLTTTSYQLTDLEPATSYRWMVVATDGQAVAEGPTWVFTTRVSADVNRDARIDLLDYALLSDEWKRSDCNDVNDWCESADVDKSSVVDFNDLQVLAEQWLNKSSSELSKRVAIINPDHSRILKHGIKLETSQNTYTYFSIAHGQCADGCDQWGFASNNCWSGTGEQPDFIGSVLQREGFVVDYYEAADMPYITRSEYGAVIVQDPLKTNLMQFTVEDAENGSPDILTYVTEPAFIAKLDHYIETGGKVVLVGDAVRLLEDGPGRLNYGKSVQERRPMHSVDQASNKIPSDWLFVRGNPFCGKDRVGSGEYGVAGGSLLPFGTVISQLQLSNLNDAPTAEIWSDTIYFPSDGISLMDVQVTGSAEYVLDGSVCLPTVYTTMVDDKLSNFFGYTRYKDHEMYYIASDSFFDFLYTNHSGAWHARQYSQIDYDVTPEGENAIVIFINHILRAL